jgi:tRNA/rRNA methyltransferase
MSSLENIRIVLVGPLYGGNVGSVCRVMKNMGLNNLNLVAPDKDLDWDEAKKFAYRAVDVLKKRNTFPTLAEAVADCGLVAGASARVGMYRDHAKSPREWAPDLLEGAQKVPVAIVFGREDKGLTNEELALCTQIIQIPSSDEYTSLNLSHAVMVCCYEMFVAADIFEPSEEKSPEAPSHMRERMFALWEKTLRANGFMMPEKADHMMMGLRRILSRGTLTDNDVRILMGMASQSLWSENKRRELNGEPTVE